MSTVDFYLFEKEVESKCMGLPHIILMHTLKHKPLSDMKVCFVPVVYLSSLPSSVNTKYVYIAVWSNREKKGIHKGFLDTTRQLTISDRDTDVYVVFNNQFESSITSYTRPSSVATSSTITSNVVDPTPASPSPRESKRQSPKTETTAITTTTTTKNNHTRTAITSTVTIAKRAHGGSDGSGKDSKEHKSSNFIGPYLFYKQSPTHETDLEKIKSAVEWRMDMLQTIMIRMDRCKEEKTDILHDAVTIGTATLEGMDIGQLDQLSMWIILYTFAMYKFSYVSYTNEYFDKWMNLEKLLIKLRIIHDHAQHIKNVKWLKEFIPNIELVTEDVLNTMSPTQLYGLYCVHENKEYTHNESMDHKSIDLWKGTLKNRLIYTLPFYDRIVLYNLKTRRLFIHGGRAYIKGEFLKWELVNVIYRVCIEDNLLKMVEIVKKKGQTLSMLPSNVQSVVRMVYHSISRLSESSLTRKKRPSRSFTELDGYSGSILPHIPQCIQHNMEHDKFNPNIKHHARFLMMQFLTRMALTRDQIEDMMGPVKIRYDRESRPIYQWKNLLLQVKEVEKKKKTQRAMGCQAIMERGLCPHFNTLNETKPSMPPPLPSTKWKSEQLALRKCHGALASNHGIREATDARLMEMFKDAHPDGKIPYSPVAWAITSIRLEERINRRKASSSSSSSSFSDTTETTTTPDIHPISISIPIPSPSSIPTVLSIPPSQSPPPSHVPSTSTTALSIVSQRSLFQMSIRSQLQQRKRIKLMT